MTTPSNLADYCNAHDITLLDGLNLISKAIKEASNSTSDIVPVENDKKEIEFLVQTANGEYRTIEIKPSLLAKASKRLATMVQRFQSSKEIEALQFNKSRKKIVSGAISDKVNNGYFINLSNVRGFMPLKKSIEAEDKLGLYSNGQRLYFEIASSSIERNGKPRVILSRKSALIAKAIAENLFSIYGFVNLKRKAGEKQTIIVRAYPQKYHQTIYQSYFPTEKIIYRKILTDGTIAPIERKAKK